MVNCWAPLCSHNSVRDSCSFFRFPSNNKLRKSWAKIVRRADSIPSSNNRLCSCHFNDNSRNNGPSIFAWNKDRVMNFSPPEKFIRCNKIHSSGKFASNSRSASTKVKDTTATTSTIAVEDTTASTSNIGEDMVASTSNIVKVMEASTSTIPAEYMAASTSYFVEYAEASTSKEIPPCPPPIPLDFHRELVPSDNIQYQHSSIIRQFFSTYTARVLPETENDVDYDFPGFLIPTADAALVDDRDMPMSIKEALMAEAKQDENRGRKWEEVIPEYDIDENTSFDDVSSSDL